MRCFKLQSITNVCFNGTREMCAEKKDTPFRKSHSPAAAAHTHVCQSTKPKNLKAAQQSYASERCISLLKFFSNPFSKSLVLFIDMHVCVELWLGGVTCGTASPLVRRTFLLCRWSKRFNIDCHLNQCSLVVLCPNLLHFHAQDFIWWSVKFYKFLFLEFLGQSKILIILLAYTVVTQITLNFQRIECALWTHTTY